MRRNAIGSGGSGAGGGGSAATLQSAYEGGNTIAVTTAEGAPTVSNSADATDLLNLNRTFAGAGVGAAISMGATTTGHGLTIDMVAGATGRALYITGAFAHTSGTRSPLREDLSFAPPSGTGSFASLHLNPTINGTSSGKAAALAIASVTNTLTGGTVRLLDVGSSTTDYFTGFTSYFSVGGTGAFTVAPASGQAISFTAVAAATTLAGPSSSSILLGSSGQITLTSAAAQAITLTGPSSSSLVISTAGAITGTSAASQAVTFNGTSSSQMRLTTAGIAELTCATNTATGGIQLHVASNYSGTTNRAFLTINDDAKTATQSSTARHAWILALPVFNGTSTGAGVGLAIAQKNTAWGNTPFIVDFGSTTTDYDTGYTSLFKIDQNGDCYRGAVAAATAVAVAGSFRGSRTLQTTDATVTTIVTIPTSSDKAYTIAVVGAACQSNGDTGAAFEKLFTFRNNGGTPVEVGTAGGVDIGGATTKDAGFATTAITADVSGTTLRIRVTGVAATTINWRVLVNVVEA